MQIFKPLQLGPYLSQNVMYGINESQIDWCFVYTQLFLEAFDSIFKISALTIEAGFWTFFIIEQGCRHRENAWHLWRRSEGGGRRRFLPLYFGMPETPEAVV